MKLTKEQHDCPYCHENVLGQIKQIIKLTMNDDELEPDIHEALVDPRHGQIALQGYVGGRGEYSVLKKINFCPVCGRDLRRNNDE